MLSNRTVEMEWLDELPATDPDAVRSRRDLQRVNRWMGNGRVLAQLLSQPTLPQAPKVIVELGAGDGTLMLQLLRRMERAWSGGTVVLVDRQPVVTDATRGELRSLGWEVDVAACDVFEWLKQTDGTFVDLMATNLFLHHFTESRLHVLLRLIARNTLVFAACEPRRSRFALNAARLLWLIACNAVTQHDAVISVRAGFTGNELSNLWPESNDWQLDERKVWPFSHAFVARRRGTMKYP